jgi:hypothetical protein
MTMSGFAAAASSNRIISSSFSDMDVASEEEAGGRGLVHAPTAGPGRARTTAKAGS